MKVVDEHNKLTWQLATFDRFQSILQKHKTKKNKAFRKSNNFQKLYVPSIHRNISNN